MKKLPYGISNYEKIMMENYYYVDKTKYIEMLENLPENYVMLLRPRKFGKTLFTSTLEYYYDINAKEKFEKLYGETYIGKNPTNSRNSYYILRFNFSGIDTSSTESTINGFKREVTTSIDFFVKKYNIDFYTNKEEQAEDIFDDLIKAFSFQKQGKQIYVIIDEYNHFANELLGFNTEVFKELVSKNGKIRKWYEILKKGTETVIDRIFITGVAPITLDSLTSGFNICSDKTQDRRFNEMLGFTNNELKELLNNQEILDENQEKIMPIMKENYDGYKFSVNGKEKIYNSNMCLFFLKDYVEYKEIPEKIIDVNIVSDYTKLSNMLSLCKSEKKKEILEKVISGEGIITEITEKFNPVIEFQDSEFASMLYYLGYLTIDGEILGKPKLKIPNRVMSEIYSSYFLNIINKENDLSISNDEYNKILAEIALEGKIDKLVEIVHRYLNNLSNRDYQKFDEKYVKLIFYCIVMNLKLFWIKSELEINRNYPDLLLIPKDNTKGYKSVMMEFKYLKKEEKIRLEEKQKEAKEQLERYSEFEEVKKVKDLNKYAVVVVNDELYVELFKK